MSNSNNGWIKLHRKMQDNPIIMKDADYLAVWVYLLLNATHTEYPALFKGKKIMLQPGQLITGRKSISEKLVISESKVSRILDAFKSEQQIEQQTSNRNRLITIKKWHSYQISEQQNEQQMNNRWTTDEQQMDTNKNVKNIKNGKNERKTYSDVPELNNAIVKFIKFRESIKKPMSDDAIELMLSKLNELAPNTKEQIDILNESILNGWPGIYPLNKESNKKPNTKGKKEFDPWINGQMATEYEIANREFLESLKRPVMVNDNPELKAEAEDLKKMLQEKY